MAPDTPVPARDSARAEVLAAASDALRRLAPSVPPAAHELLPRLFAHLPAAELAARGAESLAEASLSLYGLAARRMPGGGLVLAQQQLSPALSLFPKSSLIPYNLACYACQLGDIEEAMRCFSIAETRHGKSPKKTECIRTRALEDADLAPVHDWIRNLPKSRKK